MCNWRRPAPDEESSARWSFGNNLYFKPVLYNLPRVLLYTLKCFGIPKYFVLSKLTTGQWRTQYIAIQLCMKFAHHRHLLLYWGSVAACVVCTAGRLISELSEMVWAVGNVAVAQLDHSDYHVDKTVSAAAAAGSATDVTVDVTFEPSSIGDTRASLLLSSSVGGDYTFPLFGVCLPPKPQVLFLLIDVTLNKSYD